MPLPALQAVCERVGHAIEKYSYANNACEMLAPKMTIPEALKLLDLQPGCSEQEARRAFHIYAEKWQPLRFAGDARRQAVARRKLQLGNSAFHVLAAACFETTHSTGEFTLESTDDAHEYSPDIPDTSGEETYRGEQERYHSAASDDGECNTANVATIRLRHYVAAAICCLFLLGLGAIGIRSRSSMGHDSPSATASAAKPNSPPATSSIVQPNKSSESDGQAGEPAGRQRVSDLSAAEKTSKRVVSPTTEASQPAKPVIEETTQGQAVADKPVQSDDHTFFLGSTPAQVARAQGTPIRVDGDTWYFGSPPNQSTVKFRGERVVEWSSEPNARLRVSGLPGNKRTEWPSRFTIGSHKTAVAAIQGAPDRVVGDVWFFGQQSLRSQVTFKDNRVVTWDSNPARQLKVAVSTPSDYQLPGHAAYSQAVAAMYAIGRSEDPELANELFRQSADQGHPGACVELGFIYCRGNGSIASGQWGESDKWFREAAKTAGIHARLNNPAAMFAYAALLSRGVEEELNDIAACEWLQQSGRMDHVPSLIALGYMLWDSEASPETTAFIGTTLRRAHDLDASRASAELACVLMLTKTPQEASSEVNALLPSAISRNVAAAHHGVAYALQNGWLAIADQNGTPIGPARNAKAAYESLLRAYRLNRHDGGNLAANIAKCLFNGDGVSKDVGEGMKYMQIACKSDPWAMLQFADMIHDGEHVRKDERTADTWYRRALSEFIELAKRGDQTAALEAARCYEEGVGTNQDLQEARRLYRLAASSVNASTKRAAIDKLLEYGDPVEGDALIPPF